MRHFSRLEALFDMGQAPLFQTLILQNACAHVVMQGEHAHLQAEARLHVAAMQRTAGRMNQSAEMMTLAVMTQAQCVWMYLFGRFSLPGPRDHDATGTTQIECHASIKID